jgi:hypothetical protein
MKCWVFILAILALFISSCAKQIDCVTTMEVYNFGPGGVPYLSDVDELYGTYDRDEVKYQKRLHNTKAIISGQLCIYKVRCSNDK